MIDHNLILIPAATHTATETGDAISAASLRGDGAFRTMIHATAIKGGDADETYVLEVQASADAAFTSPTTLATATLDRDTIAAFKREIPLSGSYLRQQLPTARYMRAVLTLGGTDPSITSETFIERI